MTDLGQRSLLTWDWRGFSRSGDERPARDLQNRTSGGVTSPPPGPALSRNRRSRGGRRRSEFPEARRLPPSSLLLSPVFSHPSKIARASKSRILAAPQEHQYLADGNMVPPSLRAAETRTALALAFFRRKNESMSDVRGPGIGQ